MEALQNVFPDLAQWMLWSCRDRFRDKLNVTEYVPLAENPKRRGFAAPDAPAGLLTCRARRTHHTVCAGVSRSAFSVWFELNATQLSTAHTLRHSDSTANINQAGHLLASCRSQWAFYDLPKRRTSEREPPRAAPAPAILLTRAV